MTGSGFGTALLSLKAREVTTYEIDPVIFAMASENLHRAGIVNVNLRDRDGADPGGSERYDLIVLSGSVREVPQACLDRLNVGGRLFAIVGVIERQQMVGRLIARDSRGVLVGVYEERSRTTRDAHGRLVGRANLLAALLFQRR